MRFARFSIAGLLGAVGLCGFGLACLLYASTPWAAAMYSVTLGLLTLALIGVVYRTGERRAFWVGFAICGWVCMTLTTGPWFRDAVGPRLVTTRLLTWAYPWLVPEGRRPSESPARLQGFLVRQPILGEGLTIDAFNVGRQRVDVWVGKEGKKDSSLLLEDVLVFGFSTSGNSVIEATLMTNNKQYARLSQAADAVASFRLERHRPGPFRAFWATPPVTLDDFRDVGQSWFGLFLAWIGGWVGRYFYATRDPTP